MANPPSDSFSPDRDGLVGHDLRPHSQAICRREIDRHAKIRCVVLAASGIRSILAVRKRALRRERVIERQLDVQSRV